MQRLKSLLSIYHRNKLTGKQTLCQYHVSVRGEQHATPTEINNIIEQISQK